MVIALTVVVVVMVVAIALTVVVVVMVVVVAMVVVTVMSTAGENMHVDTCRQSNAVVAFGFNVQADEGNAFFVLIFAHFHHGMELGCVEGTIFVGVEHGEHHFHPFSFVVVVIVAGSFVAVVVMFLPVIVVAVRHGVKHFSKFTE